MIPELVRNRSRSPGMTGHDEPESPVTFVRNQRSRCSGIPNLAGDQLLTKFAHLLRSLVRASDTVGRQGGDEFVILLEQFQQRDDVLKVAAKIIEAMRSPFEVAGNSITASTSIGIAYSQDADSGDAILARADAALYEAKRAGKNVFRVAHDAGVNREQ